jgi:3-methyladenine DNA glycosylase AlkD
MPPKPQAAAIARRISRRIRALPKGTVPELRSLRRALSRELRDAPGGRVVEVATLLAQATADSGHRFVAYELVQRHPRAPASLGARSLERLGRGISSWEQVDCFSTYVSGPAWREGRVETRQIHRWARSPDRWWRRAALVSTVPLNLKAQGGTGDIARTLRVCDLLRKDRDPMVVKALSWALRVLARPEPEAVRAYVRRNADSLPALALREVRNKLETGLKNPPRRRKRGA